MHFILQQNINENDLKSLIDAIEKEGHTYETFFHIPFDTSYPNLENTTEDLFVYAASSVTDQIFDDYEYRMMGVCNHTKSININKLYDKASDLMWSNRIYQGTLESLIDLDLDCELFVRPEIDDKLFSGMVCDSLELCDMAKRMIEADSHLSYEKVFVAEVNMPMIEYRLFIVGDEVVTSSKYRENGIVITEHDSPQNVKDIALEFYKRVGMRIPCVIDVAVSENDIGVIEVNSIHNSGFYAIDKEKLIRALAKEFIETW